MKTLTLVGIILAAICCLQNCKQDPCKGKVAQERITKFDIADSLKTAIPYTGKDTLIFVNEVLDTATFFGTEYYGYYDDVQYQNYSDCPGSYVKYRYEHIFMEFKGPHPSVNRISFEVYRSPDIVASYNGFNIVIKNISYDLFPFDAVAYYLPIEDSINIHSRYSKGVYADVDKTILYNKEYGILKFKIFDHTWRKIN